VAEGRSLVTVDISGKCDTFVKIYFHGVKNTCSVWKSTIKEKDMCPKWTNPVDKFEVEILFTKILEPL